VNHLHCSIERDVGHRDFIGDRLVFVGLWIVLDLVDLKYEILEGRVPAGEVLRLEPTAIGIAVVAPGVFSFECRRAAGLRGEVVSRQRAAFVPIAPPIFRRIGDAVFRRVGDGEKQVIQDSRLNLSFVFPGELPVPEWKVLSVVAIFDRLPGSRFVPVVAVESDDVARNEVAAVVQRLAALRVNPYSPSTPRA
jgi:hypothetical protein